MKYLKPFLTLLCAVVLFRPACVEREEQLTLDENVQVHSEQSRPVDPGQLLPVLMSLQDSVKNHPDEIRLREKLLARSMDVEKAVIRAVGLGKPPANVTSSAMARQFAERAAYVDGCRWLAYLAEWKKDPTTPRFGEIEVELPGSRVLYKSDLVDSTLTVLVETDITF
jgi:hypothetical protein